MTSPNRETEAQQVVAEAEQIVLTKAKASLREKRGTIRVNLELAKTTTDQEQQEKMALKILKRDHREMGNAVALDQEPEETVTIKISKRGHREMATAVTKADHQETEKEAALNQEKVIAATSDQEQEEMATLKISKADRQEMEKEAALNQEKATAAISDQEQVKMERAAASDLKAQEVQEALQASNPAHSKKAVLKKCQEMKAAVM